MQYVSFQRRGVSRCGGARLGRDLLILSWPGIPDEALEVEVRAAVLLIASRHDLQRAIRQRRLQLQRFSAAGAHLALGSVVRKANRSAVTSPS